MVAFIVLPLLELWVLIQAGSAIGVLNTIVLVIAVSAVGAWMVRREGFGLLARVQGRLQAGEVPTNELVDGLLVAMAGALMLTPGFVTDGFGLLCLFPPTRAVIRSGLISRYKDRVAVRSTFPKGSGGGPRPGGRGDVIDVGDVDYQRSDEPPEELS